MTRLKKALSVVAAASLMASALLIAPPFGSAADITGEDGYTWKVEADNPEGRVTGSAARRDTPSRWTRKNNRLSCRLCSRICWNRRFR